MSRPVNKLGVDGPITTSCRRDRQSEWGALVVSPSQDTGHGGDGSKWCVLYKGRAGVLSTWWLPLCFPFNSHWFDWSISIPFLSLSLGGFLFFFYFFMVVFIQPLNLKNPQWINQAHSISHTSFHCSLFRSFECHYPC